MKKLFYIFVLLIYSISATAQTKVSWQNAGDKAFYSEDYASALNYYLTALEYDEKDPFLLMMAGECNRRLFEYKSALLWFNRAAMEDKNHQYSKTYYRKAETHLALSEVDEADKMLNNFMFVDSTPSNYQLVQKLRSRIADVRLILAAKDTTDLMETGKNINTAFSDFAAVASNDTLLMFSSLRFVNENSKKKEYASMILQAKMDSSSIDKPKLLPESINNKSWHNCNASVSPDGKIMIFSRCTYNAENKLICKLYESVLLNNKWQTPVMINSDINSSTGTNTQPCISSAGSEGYHLFFASDRTGGAGQTDIYHTIRNATGVYSKSESVKNINTAGKEVSPYFNPLTGNLYFSSDSLSGLGAFDIYKIKYNDNTATPENIGLPFNSGYNDIYFSENLYRPGSGFLSSNRPGTLELNGSVCCYDIFRFKPAPPVVEEIAIRETENLLQINPVLVSPQPEILQNNLQQLLPLKLFFDNDYPDPGSRKSTTANSYEKLYLDYSARLNNYISGFSSDRSRSEDEARDAIEKFFINDLQYNYKQLDKFSTMLLEVLKDSNSIKLSVQGFASPLADTRYNLILSARRINSLLNYWKKWNAGLLLVYIESGQLAVEELASGERTDTGISDNLSDKANSVYNPKAANERRIEVLNVSVSKK